MATDTAIKTIIDLHDDGVVDGAYKLYGTKDFIVIFNGYPSDTEHIAILNAYCEDKGYEWYYDDSAWVINNTAYTDQSDIIFTDGDMLGRADFESGDFDFSDIEDDFIDTPSRALPSWYNDKELEKLGFEKLSCEFDSGLYEHNKQSDPTEISKQIRSNRPNAKKEIIFKVDFVSQFEMGFCVFVRSDDIED